MDTLSKKSNGKKWFLLAGGLSLGIHFLVVQWMEKVCLADYAIPAQAALALPFQIKRVEVDSSLVEKKASFLPQGSMPSLETVEASQILVPLDTLTQQAQKKVRPQMTLPPPPDPTEMALQQATASTPFSFSKEASVDIEINEWEIGAFDPVRPIFQEKRAPMPSGEDATHKASGAQGETAVPRFEQVVLEFRSPEPGWNPRMPEPVLLRLPSDVLFDFDSAELQPEAFPLLEKAVDLIAEYTTARVQVDGHTDTIGSEDYNKGLSLQRAQAVVTWLARRLDAQNYTFHPRGFGKNRPLIFPQGTQNQQQPNRRVEITIQAIKI